MKLELKSFNVAGVAYRPANIIDNLNTHQRIRFVDEPTNPYDANAIKVEALFNQDPEETWDLIGYIPKKDTWLYHILRRAGVTIYPELFVNHDAADIDKLLVRVSYEGNPSLEFNHSITT